MTTTKTITPLFSETFEKGQIIEGVKFARFNKNDILADYVAHVSNEDYNVEKVEVKKVVKVSNKDFEEITNSLLSDRVELFDKIGGSEWDDKNLPESIGEYTEEHWEVVRKIQVTHVVALASENGRVIFVNTEGYGYARYVGLLPGFKAESLEAFGSEATEKKEAETVEAPEVAGIYTQNAVAELQEAIKIATNDEAKAVLAEAIKLIGQAEQIGFEEELPTWVADIVEDTEDYAATATEEVKAKTLQDAVQDLQAQGVDMNNVTNLKKL